jgi:hypothetical protein
MALTKTTGGVDLIQERNINPWKAEAAYLATAAVGDLVVASATETKAVLRASAQATLGEVISINSGNGILSIAESMTGVVQVFETTGAVVLGNKLWSNGDRGVIVPQRDRLIVNAGGNWVAIAVGVNSPLGVANTVMARAI